MNLSLLKPLPAESAEPAPPMPGASSATHRERSPLRQFLNRWYLTPLTAMLSLVVVLLFCGFIYQLIAPPVEFAVPHVVYRPRTSPQVVVAAFTPPNIEQFAEIDARPVFAPLRRPPPSPEEKQAVAAALPPPSIALVGVILQGDTAIALTKAAGASASVSIRPGEKIEGWEVVQIQPDRMTLRADTRTYEVQLQSFSSGQGGDPSALAPSPPPAPQPIVVPSSN